ncbi:hypothetical protein VTH06DRAFT_4997 [Thermothelomyces fergusii]
MFQRLKGAIDRTIAEEQARQRASLESQRSASTLSSTEARRPQSSSTAGTQSSARRSRPPKKAGEDLAGKNGNGIGNGEGANPDPAVFEAAFVVDDTDDSNGPTRVATPSSVDKDANASGPGNEATKPDAGTPVNEASGDPAGDNGAASKTSAEIAGRDQPAATPAPSELPPEIRARLRKLERLENTYPELLRSYRIAHSRAKAIEPFEKALKENTPLTSIKDPEALVEYLNQINLKGDMVMEELRRVTSEKETYKKKADEADSELVRLKEELAALRSAHPAQTPTPPDTEGTAPTEAEATADKTAESPKEKAAEGKGGETFFSFDDEFPQLQAEVQKKSEEIEQLRAEVKNLKEELSIAKEHSAGLVESLEKTARELSEARDAVAVKAAIEKQLEARNTEISTLGERLDKAQIRLKDLEAQVEKTKGEAAEAVKEKEAQLAASENRAKELEIELTKAGEAKSSLDEKIKSLTSEIETLKEAKAEDEARIEELIKQTQSTPAPSVPPASPAPSKGELLAPPPAGGGKKKNKKKKKGGASATPTAAEPAPSEASTGDQPAMPSAEGPSLVELQAELARLQEELAEKDQRIERLSKQRKTEEDLREEIENLQENLMMIGQDHVEAKERIKELEAEKRALKERIAELEKEVASSASAARGNTELQSEHEALKEEFESLKMKSATLQSDLAAAQQLAQARYKDLTELRES